MTSPRKTAYPIEFEPITDDALLQLIQCCAQGCDRTAIAWVAREGGYATCADESHAVEVASRASGPNEGTTE